MTGTAQPWLVWPGFTSVVSALGAENVRVVGGAVRDAWLGLPVNDVDLATTLLPDQVSERLQAKHLKAVPTGLAHGTITALADQHSFEITTLREDLATDGRHAVVAFTDNWQTDASRRDFTINALYMDCDGKVYDYFGGLDDLKAGRVCFIGDAVKRIEEDALRIMRFFRFSARFSSGNLDAAGLAACVQQANHLMALSRERIRDELLKILAVSNPLPIIDSMIDHGMFKPFLPEATSASALSQLVASEHMLGDESVLRRLFVLLPQNAAICEDVAIRLKFSVKERQRLVAMADNRIGRAEPSLHSMRTLIYKLGRQGFIDQLIVHAPSKRLYEQGQLWVIPKLPIKGGDLIASGVTRGPDVSRLLAEIENDWMEADFPADKDVVMKMAEVYVSRLT